MADHTLVTINIIKSPKCWHAETLVTYPGWQQNGNYAGHNSLAWALYDEIESVMRLSANPELVCLTVKGEIWSRKQIYDAIYNKFSRSGLSYNLPAIRKFLLS